MVDLAKIEKLRDRKGWTQDQAAMACGMRGGRQAWNNLVGGRGGPSLKLLDRIAKAFGVSAKTLLK